VVTRGDETIFESGTAIGIQTNNVAEYTAVLKAVEFLTSLSPAPTQVDFFLDSLLVVQQLNGKYAVKNLELRKLHLQIQNARKNLSFLLTFSYVPRAQNAAADALVNQALDKQIQDS